MYETDVLVSFKWALNTYRGHFMKMEELWAVLVFKKHHNFSLKNHISIYWYSLLQCADMKGLLCFFGKQNWNPDIFAHPPRSRCWANWLILTVHSAQDVSKMMIFVPVLDPQSWIIAAAATGQRRSLHWVSSPPVPPREGWEGWVWGWSGRSCGLEGISPGVSLQAVPQVLSTATHPARALHCCFALALPQGSLLRFKRPGVEMQ